MRRKTMNSFDLESYLNGMFFNTNKQNNLTKNNNNTHINQTITLFGPYEGFMKGNLYSNLYDPYKNYTPAQLTPSNQYEEDLLNLNQMQFAAHEINLFLDNYPSDTNMITLYNKYKESYLKLLQEFENKYGPVTVSSDVLNTTPWNWDKEPWPWEGDAN